MFLVAAVARIYRPGCKTDYMLILESEQGEEKSKACKIRGDQWFSDQLPSIHLGKEVSQHLRGKWIIEAAELHALSRAEVNQLKSFFTRATEQYRPAYGHKEVHEPRQCVFIGTTSKEVHLRDETGNRRYWPVKCGKIKLDDLQRDRDQLYAETVVLFHGGAHWWPDKAFELQHIKEQQEERFEDDPWEKSIHEYVAGLLPPKRTTISDVARYGLGFLSEARIGTADARRISAVLERAGWKRLRSHGVRWWAK